MEGEGAPFSPSTAGIEPVLSPASFTQLPSPLPRPGLGSWMNESADSVVLQPPESGQKEALFLSNTKDDERCYNSVNSDDDDKEVGD